MRTSYSAVRTNAKVARMTWSGPSSGTRPSIRSACGWWRHMNASWSTRPAASAASQAISTSSACRVYGFSQRTCLPAASAVIVQGWWSEFGSEM